MKFNSQMSMDHVFHLEASNRFWMAFGKCDGPCECDGRLFLQPERYTRRIFEPMGEQISWEQPITARVTSPVYNV